MRCVALTRIDGNQAEGIVRQPSLVAISNQSPQRQLIEPGRTKAMTHLTELSTELLLHIASFLPQVDLLNISLTSTRLRNATEAELYREWTNHPNIHRRGEERRIIPFLRRIIEHPKLARYVHYLETNLWSTLTDWNPVFEKEDVSCLLSPEDYEYFANAALSANVITLIREYDHKSNILVRAMRLVDWPRRDELELPGWANFLYEPGTHIDQVPFDNKFCQLLQAGIEEPLFLLAFALLPNLREIRLRGAPHSGQSHHLLPAFNPDHHFSALKRLTIGAQDGELEWPLSTFTHQLQSPSLQILECYCTTEWEREELDEPWKHRPFVISVPPRSLSITRVMLQWSALSAAGIKNLLGACQTLKSFYFSAGGSKVGPPNFNTSELMEALAPHKSSLEILQIDMFTEWDDDFNEPGCITDLSDFTAVETLVLTLELENWEFSEGNPTPSSSRLCNILPTSLRSLTFQDTWPKDSNKQIEEMMALRPDKFQSLEKITVTTDTTREWLEAARKGQDTTVKMCKEAGVELVVTTVIDNHQLTFFETWTTKRKWHDISWKDDRYVREQRQPKTREELRREGVLSQGE